MKAYSAYKESGVIWFGEIPIHWYRGQLKYILEGNDGGVWGDDTDDKGTIVFRSTEITVDGQWQIENPAIRLLDIKEIEKATLKAGDLLITKSSGSEAHIGKTALVTPDIEKLAACYSNFMQRIHPKDEVDSKYLHYFLNSSLAREQYNYFSTTTTGLANLNAEIINNLRVPFIPLPEQQTIADFLDRKTTQIDTLIAKKQRQIDLLQEQRIALINQAVTKGLNPSAPMKDSGVAWLGEIPSHWEVTRLKHVSSLQTGVTLGKNYAGQETIERPYIRVANVQDGYLDLKDIKYIALPSEEASRYELQIGDVVLTEGGDFDKLGRGYVWEGQIDRCLHQNHIFAVRPFTKSLDSYYLAFLMSSRHGKNYFTSIAKQTTNLATTNSTQLNNFIMILPPLKEQELIISYINNRTTTLDKIIEKISQIIERLQEYRTALISEAVTGKIDVRTAG